MSGNRFEIRVPATSANMGPGFDVIGLAVNILLKLDISLYEEVPSSAKNPGFNVEIQYSGDNSTVPLEPEKNIILVVALFILKENGFSKFPKYTKVVAENNIPLGRGMGSSAAAIVAGAILANEVGKLGFSREELLKYCLVFENHPDNITPAMVGGIVASYINHASNSDDNTATADANKGSNKSISGDSIDFVRVPYSDKIKAVTVVPQFELSTSVARSVLPTSYEKSDVVFNLQRLSVLTLALGAENPNPNLIYNAMKDKLHQPYRKQLVPGLEKIVDTLNPQNTPGLLGVCLSGAGPTVLALATDNFEQIAHKIQNIFKEEASGKFTTKFYISDIPIGGSTVEYI